MKILIITSSYPENPEDSVNAGVFVRDFAKTLKKKGHSVTVLTPRKGKNNYDDEIDVIYFWWLGEEKTLTNLNFKNPINIFKAFSLLCSGLITGLYLCAKERYHHILAMWAIPSGVIAYILYLFTRISYSVWALGSDIWMFKKNRLGKVFLKIILKSAKNIFADGWTLAKDVEEIAGKPCSFLPSSRLLPPPRKLKFESDKTHFLFIGRFHPNKGIDILVDAIFLLPEEVKKKCHFHIFGDGPLKMEIEKKLEKNQELKNCISLKGYANPITASSYLHACDALVIPSRIESIPVILSDAAQAGIPVIATDVGDMGKIVNKYEAGVVVEPTSSSIAEGIINFLKCKPQQFREGMKLLYKEFDIENSVNKILSFLKTK